MGSSGIVFMGTPEFALPTLQALREADLAPDLVITQPDRPKGRGLQLTAPPVKCWAEEHGIEVYQPEQLRTEAQCRLERMAARIVVVVAYAAKIPDWCLAWPEHGCINLHPSLLPKLRGAAPLQWALINGETRTGVTSFYLNEAWDAGDIVYQQPLEILPGEGYPELAVRAAQVGAQLMVRSVRDILAGTAPRTPQHDAQATFAPLLKPDQGRLDFTRSAEELVNLIRGTTPRPGAFTCMPDGKRLKVLQAEAVAAASGGMPGQVVWVDRVQLEIACGQGRLKPLQLQVEGKRPAAAADFINGYRITTDVRLGAAASKGDA